jgi:prepilin-type processing-associated H-X9-DG protein
MTHLKTGARLLGLGLLGVAVAGLTPAAEPNREGAGGPALAAARQRDANNLKQLALAMINYADANRGQLPPPAVLGKDGKALLSWRVLLLPYVEEGDLFKQFKLDEPWDSDHNKTLLARMPKVFAPVRGKTEKAHSTFYQVFVGKGASFVPGQRMRFPASFTDGTSNTIMIAEAAEAVPWTRPADLAYDAAKPLPKLGGQFPDGCNVAFWDGSVHFFRKNFDPQEMRSAITPSGGEVINFRKLER